MLLMLVPSTHVHAMMPGASTVRDETVSYTKNSSAKKSSAMANEAIVACRNGQAGWSLVDHTLYEGGTQ